MNWSQGIALRDELPQPFVRMLDGNSQGFLEAVSWHVDRPGRFAALYYFEGEVHEQVEFQVKYNKELWELFSWLKPNT